MRQLYKYDAATAPPAVSGRLVDARGKIMLILWILIVTQTAAHKVYESTEDIGPEAFQNVTTLYPINNLNNNNIFNNTADIDKIPNNHKVNNDITNNIASNDSNSKEDKRKTGKTGATVWKLEAAFAESNLDKHEKENLTHSKDTTDSEKNDSKEFKPSLPLGSFVDEDSLQVTPTRASFGSYTPVKKPSSGFVSPNKDDYRTFTKIPKQILQTHKQYPYKFESPILTRAKDPWTDSLETRPTAEVPVKVPAGGFYKYEDPFKEETGKEDDDFELGFNENGKNNALKKRINPWENFLRLVTAFLPVGLIISALTPSIITIEDTGPGANGNNYPSNLYRRSDPQVAELPVISEWCRRRLLCELHSDKNYKPSRNSQVHLRGKHCYKIHCEDSEALARTLQWLLEYRRSTQNGHYT